MELLGGVVEVGEQVEPEGGAGGEPLADRVVDLALGASSLALAGGGPARRTSSRK